MIAIRSFSKTEIIKRLKPYGCQHVSTLKEGVEMWKTGWDEPFSLSPEEGRYDEWMYRMVLSNVIATTMPPDWNEPNGAK